MATVQKIKRVVSGVEENSKPVQTDFSIGFIEMIPFPVAYISNNNRYEYVNKAYLDWRELKKENIIGKKVDEFLEPSIYELAKGHILTALNGTPARYEIELPYKTGHRYAEVIYTPKFDQNAEVEGYLAFITDITERKKSQELNAQMAAIVQSSDDAIIAKTLNGTITSWNAAAEKLFGYTELEMIGQSIMKLIPKDREGEESEIISKLRKGEKIDHFETKRVTKQGNLLDISLTISPILDSNGIVIGASKIARDITGRKKSEEVNARLAAIVQSSDDVIIGKTLDGIITNWNNAAEKLFGYTEKEMIGESITKIIPPERINEEYRILSQLREGKNVEHFETKRMAKDGKLIDVSLTSSPIKDPGGNIIGASKIARNIGLQKETERLIHEAEERFRMAVEMTSLGTWEYDPKGLTFICSPETRKICGIPQNADPAFTALINHVYEEDQDHFVELLNQAIKPVSKSKFDLEVRVRRFNNNEDIRWVHIRAKMFFDDDHAQGRLVGTMLDITEEKARELELKKSVELFQTMADNVPAMIWMSGTDKFDDYFNKTWLEFTGRTHEEEGNEGWLEAVHPDDVKRCIDTYNASFKGQKGFYTEYRLRRHDGEYRWIADNSIPRFSTEGEFLGFISACMDIDDQKRFREKILESELLFKTISNASPAALWMTNEDEENVFVSDTWLKWTGQNFQEVISKSWMEPVSDEDRVSMTKEFRECFQQRKNFKKEFRFKKQDGEIRWGLTEGYPFYDLDGKFSGFAGSVTDITDLKKLEQRKDDFIKMASHELKTPITSINGYVQLMLNIFNEADEQRLRSSKQTIKSSLHTISKQVVKLTRLISELLDLSRIESGKLELHKTAFDLCALVEETVQDMRQTASKHAIILHNDFEGKVFADKDRIAQVLLNLLANAIKYSPDSDSIEVFVDNDKDSAIITVKDYGIGIDKKDYNRIFERFYRAEGKSEQTFPGFGIGLFIACEIVQRHNGSITVQSEKGKGSVFTVSLPLNSEKNKEQLSTKAG
jgi:PAS domain S-box-containing protein